MRIFVYNQVPRFAIERFRKIGEVRIFDDRLEGVEKAEVLVIRSKPPIDLKFVKRCKNLRLIARLGVGIDHISDKAIGYCREKGIKIVTTAEATSKSVAELTIGLAIALKRRMVQGDKDIREGKWKRYIGSEISRKTWGVLGFGRIGRCVARLARDFGCKVIGYDPNVGEGAFVVIGVEKKKDLEGFLKECEILSIHIPLTKSTRGMLGKKELYMLPKGAYIINVARGAIVDEKALVDALKDHLGGAGLDVFKEEPPRGEILKLKNVVLSPHIGGNTKEGLRRAVDELVEKIKDDF